MRYILSINQNSFDAIQHGDALKRLFVLSLQNQCFKTLITLLMAWMSQWDLHLGVENADWTKKITKNNNSGYVGNLIYSEEKIRQTLRKLPLCAVWDGDQWSTPRISMVTSACYSKRICCFSRDYEDGDQRNRPWRSWTSACSTSPNMP